MATPIRLPFMHATYTAEGCDDLPAHVDEMDGQKLITTAWKLTPGELAAVVATGLVALQCVGFQPPINVMGVQIEQPPEARFLVTWWVSGTMEELRADTIADALTLALSAAMKDANEVRIIRL